MDKHCIQLIRACHKYEVDHVVPTLTASVERILTVGNCWQYYADLDPFYQKFQNPSLQGKPYLSCAEHLVTKVGMIAYLKNMKI